MLCDNPVCMCVLWLYKLFIWLNFLIYYYAVFSHTTYRLTVQSHQPPPPQLIAKLRQKVSRACFKNQDHPLTHDDRIRLITTSIFAKNPPINLGVPKCHFRGKFLLLMFQTSVIRPRYTLGIDLKGRIWFWPLFVVWIGLQIDLRNPTWSFLEHLDFLVIFRALKY